jgi:uracil phosphoribosyltransferase
LPLEPVEIETPVEAMQAPLLAGKKLVFAPILRAGVGLLEGMLDLVPSARVAHLGLYRDPETLAAVEYYFKAPEDVAERLVIVVDPMLATANTAIAAVDRLKARGASTLRLVCLVAAPEGVERFRRRHPDVPIWAAALDEGLNEHGYIVPGLGDAGDRLFGTR